MNRLATLGRRLAVNGSPVFLSGLNAYSLTTNNGTAYASCGPSTADADVTRLFATPGVQMVRTWWFQGMATNAAVTSRVWDRFDRILTAAEAAGVYLVCTLGNWLGDCDGPAKDTTWLQTGWTTAPASGAGYASYHDWVAEVVSRYAGRPGVGIWEPLNEPFTGADETVARQWTDQVGALIKANDPTGLVGTGTTNLPGQLFQSICDSPGVDVCSTHSYVSPDDLCTGGPSVTTDDSQDQNTQQRIVRAHAAGKPIIIGEDGAPSGFSTDEVVTSARLDAYRTAGASASLTWNWDPGNGQQCVVPPVNPQLLTVEAAGLSTSRSLAAFNGALSLSGGHATVTASGSAEYALAPTNPDIVALPDGAHFTITAATLDGSGTVSYQTLDGTGNVVRNPSAPGLTVTDVLQPGELFIRPFVQQSPAQAGALTVVAMSVTVPQGAIVSTQRAAVVAQLFVVVDPKTNDVATAPPNSVVTLLETDGQTPVTDVYAAATGGQPLSAGQIRLDGGGMFQQPPAGTGQAPVPFFLGAPRNVIGKIGSAAVLLDAVIHAPTATDVGAIPAASLGQSGGPARLNSDGQVVDSSGTPVQAGGGAVAAASSTALGTVMLAGDLGGTAQAPTVPDMLRKELLGAANGVAPLDQNELVPLPNLPLPGVRGATAYPATGGVYDGTKRAFGTTYKNGPNRRQVIVKFTAAHAASAGQTVGYINVTTTLGGGSAKTFPVDEVQTSELGSTLHTCSFAVDPNASYTLTPDAAVATSGPAPAIIMWLELDDDSGPTAAAVGPGNVLTQLGQLAFVDGVQAILSDGVDEHVWQRLIFRGNPNNPGLAEGYSGTTDIGLFLLQESNGHAPLSTAVEGDRYARWHIVAESMEMGPGTNPPDVVIERPVGNSGLLVTLSAESQKNHLGDPRAPGPRFFVLGAHLGSPGTITDDFPSGAPVFGIVNLRTEYINTTAPDTENGLTPVVPTGGFRIGGVLDLNNVGYQDVFGNGSGAGADTGALPLAFRNHQRDGDKISLSGAVSGIAAQSVEQANGEITPSSTNGASRAGFGYKTATGAYAGVPSAESFGVRVTPTDATKQIGSGNPGVDLFGTGQVKMAPVSQLAGTAGTVAAPAKQADFYVDASGNLVWRDLVGVSHVLAVQGSAAGAPTLHTGTTTVTPSLATSGGSAFTVQKAGTAAADVLRADDGDSNALFLPAKTADGSAVLTFDALAGLPAGATVTGATLTFDVRSQFGTGNAAVTTDTFDVVVGTSTIDNVEPYTADQAYHTVTLNVTASLTHNQQLVVNLGTPNALGVLVMTYAALTVNYSTGVS